MKIKETQHFSISYKGVKNISLIFSLLFITNAVFGQNGINVKGTILDEQKMTLPYANIKIKGTTKGTVSNVKGEFNIQAEEGSVLQVSFAGYTAKEVPVTKTMQESTEPIVIVLKSIQLQETVVVGYGTQKKSDLTGSVQSIESKDLLNQGAVSSPDALLAGKVAGVDISTSSGDLNSKPQIRIRGGTSISASNEPLIVIDDVPIDNVNGAGGRSSLTIVNPNNIESITVLKDASATAIYGSRGANGVIIITTKRGNTTEDLKNNFSYSGYAGVNMNLKKLDLLNANEYQQMINDKVPSKAVLLGTNSRDWQDAILQLGTVHSHYLTLSGGTNKQHYAIGGGIYDERGIMQKTSTFNTSVSVNYTNNGFLDDHLELNVGAKGLYASDSYSPSSFVSVTSINPTLADDYQGIASGNPQNTVSPLVFLKYIQNTGETFKSVGNVSLNYKFHFFPKLSLKVNGGYEIYSNISSYFASTLITNWGGTGSISKTNAYGFNKLLDVYFTYSDTFESIHTDLTALAGYSYQRFFNESTSANGTNLSTNALESNSLSPASQITASTYREASALSSFFGRVNIGFLKKYLLTANLRIDGSSRFSPSYQWGYFPSVAVAWQLLKEDFMQPVTDVLSEFKVRVGYGITGNQSIGNYKNAITYTPGDKGAQYQFGDKFYGTFRPNGVSDDLRWEQTSQYNVGVDLGFLDEKIQITADFYYKQTTNLLATVYTPQPALTDMITKNIGSLDNMGVELYLKAYLISIDNFSWNVTLNASYNRNVVTQLNNDPTKPYIMGGYQIAKEGLPLNTFYLYKYQRNPDGTPISNFGKKLIDYTQDINKDGQINEQDLVMMQKPAPDVLLGLITSFKLYDFELTISLKGSIGNYVYNQVAEGSTGISYLTAYPNYLPNLMRNTLTYGIYDVLYRYDIFLEDASYLRIDYITLGYTIRVPESKMNLWVYVTGRNLYTFTKYTGLDPEVAGGMDGGSYPRARNFIVGVNLNF